jgi:hypothetical protein
MLKYFLKYWESLVDRIIVYDNQSDDGSVELLKQYPLVEIREYDTNGYLDSDKRREIRNNCWKEARGKADWVIVVSVDEFVEAKDLRAELLAASKYDTIQPQHIEMVSDSFPTADGNIGDLVSEGVITSETNKIFPQTPKINPGFMSKVLIFNPNAIKDINYIPGAHHCFPVKFNGSSVKKLVTNKIICKHYHYLGFEWTKQRHEAANKRRNPNDIKRGYSFEYDMGDDYINDILKKLNEQKTKIIL